ncbi:hypothetical protein [Sutcliffiella sp. FSL R7-0096]|uniref:hypothetical protein n=1 Tax=Sutcliffiella sp. FSL R7-0096 TaxID=2921670 RepID=UPI0031599751
MNEMKTSNKTIGGFSVWTKSYAIAIAYPSFHIAASVGDFLGCLKTILRVDFGWDCHHRVYEDNFEGEFRMGLSSSGV